MAASYKKPPCFDPATDNYSKWRKEIDIWARITDIPDKKQALATTLSLNGSARDVTLQLEYGQIEVDGGLKVLLDHLDKSSLRTNADDEAYERFIEFKSLERLVGQPIQAFVLNFENVVAKLKGLKMTFSENILAAELLHKSGLTDTEKRIVLASSGFKIDTMKSVIGRMLANYDIPGSTVVKTETALVTKGERCSDNFGDYNSENNSVDGENVYYNRGRGNFGRNNYRGQNSNNARFNSNRGNVSRGNYSNPRGGGPSKLQPCQICNSAMHWKRDCPHQSNPSNQQNTAYFHFAVHVYFCENMTTTGIIDTACTLTVAGGVWLTNYLKFCKLTLNDVRQSSSDASFVFGGGNKIQATFQVELPICINSKCRLLCVHIVSCQLPLLISLPSLKRMEAIIDTNNDQLIIEGEPSKLQIAETGHYLLELCCDSGSTSTSFKC